MSILQVHVSHVKSEDRLLLRLTTRQDQEYRLWLTRLITEQLLLHTDQCLASAAAHTSPAAFPSEAGVRHHPSPPEADAHLSQAFQPARNLPLGAEPVMVDAYHIDQHQGRFELHLQLRTQRVLDLTLTPALLRQVRMLLLRMQKHAGWQLDRLPPGSSGEVHLGLDLSTLSPPSTAIH